MSRRIILCTCAIALAAVVVWNVRLATDLFGRSGLIAKLRRTPALASQTGGKNIGPTDAEIFRCRLFPERLVPIGGKTTAEENSALYAAIQTHKNRIDQDDHSAILSFLDQYPKSAWRAALLTNLGLEYRHTGWFLKALNAWEQAWIAGRNEKSPMGKALMDRAIGELAELNARLGRRERVEAILKEIGDRHLIGPATEKVTAAREGVWMMLNEPGNAFKCGPFALDRIRASQHSMPSPDPKVIAAQSTDHGMSLDQVWRLSGDLGMNYQMAKREPGSQVIVPSVVNWKANHYAALVREENGRYVAEDPTFGDPILVSKAVLDAESTGYFLIPNAELPKGWTRIGEGEARKVWGMGNTGDHDSTGTKTIDAKAKPDCATAGMAAYNFHLQTVSLNIVDTPVGYTPPRGPDMHFRITYNQREMAPTVNHSHSNFGSKWVCNWIAWVDGDPTAPPTNATRVFLPGGGSELHTVSSGTFSTDPQSGATLNVFPDPNTGRFERNLPGGSKQVFGLRDFIPFYGSNSVYMTKLVDPAGNATLFNYDGNFRLVSVTDALNHTTTITHRSNDINVQPDFYLISQITDPFGRSATFDYQNGQLIAIHDTIGITSQFVYATSSDVCGCSGPCPADFIKSMTTPYGTTTFSQPDSSLDASTGCGNARVIQAVDPTGAIERVEYGHQAPGITDTQPDIPAGLGIINTSYEYRNSFYWDKNATALYPPVNGVYDFTKAKLTQWLHTSDGGSSSNIKERDKMPLENAAYYLYAGQTDTRFVGQNGFPTKVARVLGDGSTQLWQYEYNSIGKITKSTDPIGRVMSYGYDPANNIDLLTIRQTTGSNNDLLRTLTYNSQHEPLSDTDAAGQPANFTYNAYGQILTRTNAKNETTTFAYGGTVPDGYLASITSPPFNASSAVTSLTYDSDNRVRSVTDSDGYTITTDYDNLDRPTQITYPDLTTQQFQYTDNNTGVMTLDLTGSRDRRGLWTYRHYNANRQMDSIKDPLNQTTLFGWCGCGSLTSISDPKNQLTTFNRDLEGRVYQKVFADNTTINYLYDGQTAANTVGASSRLQSSTDAKSQRSNYFYFADDNIQQITYTDSNGQPLNPPTPSVTYTYDPNYNRVLTMVDGIGTTVYGYNPIAVPPALGAGQLASIDGPLANDTITFGYDQLGRVTNRSINGTANSATWTFDSLGRVSSVANKLGTFNYAYVGVTNRLNSMTYPSGSSAVYTYFPNNQDKRLQEILNQTSTNALISQFDYTYDSEGQVLTWTKNYPGLSPAPQRFDLGYDNADQLHTAPLKDASTNAVIKQYTYGYDPAANRTSELVGTSSTTSTFNNVNELVSQSGGTNRTLTYDADGSLVNDGRTRTFEWDGANRLVAVNYTGTTKRSEFSYDGLSRVAKIVEKTGTTINSTRKFVWCGTEKCEYRNASDAVTLRLFPQGQHNGSVGFFYSRDHLGSVREMFKSDGTVVGRFDYDPYGRSTSVVGTNLPDFNFTGLYRHSPSSLDLAVNRAYDPSLGRWLSRDPIAEAGGINLYGYVINNPIGAIDPLGLFNPGYFVKSIEIAGEEEIIGGGPEDPAADIAAVATVVIGGALTLFMPGDTQTTQPQSVMPPPGKPPGPPTTGAACPNPPNGENEGTARGREAHKWWQPPEGFEKEFTFDNGMRADAINFDTNEILELKADNPTEIARGHVQLQNYINQAQMQFGGKWTGTIVTY